MFGDLLGMAGKLKETQEKVKATKMRLDTVLLDEVSANGAVKVTITANKEVKSVTLNESCLSDKQQLEEEIRSVMNRAIQKAAKVQETELSAVAKEGMPNIPGMDALFK